MAARRKVIAPENSDFGKLVMSWRITRKFWRARETDEVFPIILESGLMDCVVGLGQ